MGTSMDVATCQYPAAHHSADLVTVWHGAAEPLVVCGYHETAVPLTALVARVDPDDARPHELRRADELVPGDVILPWYAGEPWGERTVTYAAREPRATFGPTPRYVVRVTDDTGASSDFQPDAPRKVAR